MRTLSSLAAVLLLLVATPSGAVTDKTKRQIFREQVLPDRGGKIPDEAFRTDRLALNRLNKDGISIPDGILLDARRRDKHPALRHNSDLERSIVKLLVTPENRYTSPEGQYHPQNPITVDSTYIIRQPIGSFKRPPQTIGRPIPGPPLTILSHPFVQIHRHAAPAPRPQVYVRYPEEHTTSTTNFLLPSRETVYPDHYNTIFTAQAFPDFETLIAHLNDRATRETAAAFAAGPVALKPWPHKLPGSEGRDFPALTVIPQTNFRCAPTRRGYRMHADPETKCQVFHICQKDGRQDSFLCPKGTLFNESLNHCDWWYNVKCR